MSDHRFGHIGHAFAGVDVHMTAKALDAVGLTRNGRGHERWPSESRDDLLQHEETRGVSRSGFPVNNYISYFLQLSPLRLITSVAHNSRNPTGSSVGEKREAGVPT